MVNQAPLVDNNALTAVLTIANLASSIVLTQAYVSRLDEVLKAKGFYQRYNDDWVMLVRTKRQLRDVITLTYGIFTQLQLKMHTDKTFFGCINKGFDFLGGHFAKTPSISKTGLENHRFKVAQRYTQGASSTWIGEYNKRWSSWYAGELQSGSSCSMKINSITSNICRPLGVMEALKEFYHAKLHTS